MVSWLEELDRREAAAREEIAELRAQIVELTRRLAGREEVLSRLVITRETMTEILTWEDHVTQEWLDDFAALGKQARNQMGGSAQ
ncbi:hypothetical protein AB0G67_42815 [Streptomyces sp. NPDC021056]|uniref:hypothetical protein n=1 Tax=Streptomyces sp. NPDC021056 TaxID=3155012 RepID=UPI0033C70875